MRRELIRQLPIYCMISRMLDRCQPFRPIHHLLPNVWNVVKVSMRHDLWPLARDSNTLCPACRMVRAIRTFMFTMASDILWDVRMVELPETVCSSALCPVCSRTAQWRSAQRVALLVPFGFDSRLSALLKHRVILNVLKC